MTATEGAILGIVQGLTEFLPVSSKGHLALAGAILGVGKQSLVFKIAVHFGTLVSLLCFYWRDVLRLLSATLRGALAPRAAYARDAEFRTALQIVIGCIPVGVFGVLFEDRIEAWLDDPLYTCVGLLCTACLLFSTSVAVLRNETTLSAGRALWVGCAQVLALLPGVSRSGTTISAGLWGGLPGPVAGRFSFLMSIPLILGATVLESRKLFTQPPSCDDWIAMSVGTVCSCVTGIFALSLLLAVLRTRRFAWFGAYCLVVGGFGLAWILSHP